MGPQDTSLQLLLGVFWERKGVQFLPGAECGGSLTIPRGCGGSRGGPYLAGALLVRLLSRASAFPPRLVICASKAPSLGPQRGTK